MKSLIQTFVTVLLIISACTYDKHFPAIANNNNPNTPPYVCTDTVHFSTDLEPIISSTCVQIGCHMGNGYGGPGALDYTVFANVQIEDSAIYTRITYPPTQTGVPGFMPKNGAPLPDSIIQKFYCWWKQGGLNN